jgi:hypothetical protein
MISWRVRILTPRNNQCQYVICNINLATRETRAHALQPMLCLDSVKRSGGHSVYRSSVLLRIGRRRADETFCPIGILEGRFTTATLNATASTPTLRNAHLVRNCPLFAL